MIPLVRGSDATLTNNPARNAHRVGAKLDGAGATASFLCAIHCAVMPFLITILPLLGLSFLASEPVEWVLLGLSATLGTLSLCLGFREHRRRQIFALLGMALAFLVIGRVLDSRELERSSTFFMVAGGLTMMGAHLLNRFLCRSCRVRSADNRGGEGCCKS